MGSNEINLEQQTATSINGITLLYNPVEENA